jgi:fluoride ion exporter CrcB/FEX
MKTRHALLLICLTGVAGSLTAPAIAQSIQQRIPLDTATVNRLGIVYQAVATPGSGDGARFAAEYRQAQGGRTASQIGATAPGE